LPTRGRGKSDGPGLRRQKEIGVKPLTPSISGGNADGMAGGKSLRVKNSKKLWDPTIIRGDRDGSKKASEKGSHGSPHGYD